MCRCWWMCGCCCCWSSLSFGLFSMFVLVMLESFIFLMNMISMVVWIGWSRCCVFVCCGCGWICVFLVFMGMLRRLLICVGGLMMGLSGS